jgi:tetratricopeptide (TPR) repeat protein
MKTNQYFKAIQELKTYLAEAQGEVKDLTWGYYQLVESFMQTGEQENALLYTNKLLELEKTADNYILLARIFKNGGNMPGYINALKLATEYEPKYINILLDNLLQAKNYHEVDVITDKILKKDPYHEDALYFKSKQKFKQRFYEQAKIYLYTLIYLQLSDMKRKEEAFYMLGSILMQEGRLEDAEGFFTKVLALNPTSLKSTLKLTMIHIKNGKLAAAKDILQRTKNQSQLPSKVLSVVYAYLGYIEAQEGRFEKARYYVDRALELNPKNDIAKNVLKRLE